MRTVDVDGSANVFRAAAAAGVAHLLYLSSTTAYGAHPDNPPLLDETAPIRGNPGFPYAADKAAVERFLDRFEAEHPAIGLTRLRPCIVLGRRAENFVRAILDLWLLPRVRGHDPEMQFLHEEDLADCLALLVRARPRGAFNLAPAETVRLSEMGPLLGHPSLALPGTVLHALIGIGWSLRLFGVPPSYIDFIRWPWVADPGKLLRTTGFAPRHSSRSAVIATRRSPAATTPPAAASLR
jgi:UDP-glucose 4-epimerase